MWQIWRLYFQQLLWLTIPFNYTMCSYLYHNPPPPHLHQASSLLIWCSWILLSSLNVFLLLLLYASLSFFFSLAFASALTCGIIWWAHAIWELLRTVHCLDAACVLLYSVHFAIPPPPPPPTPTSLTLGSLYLSLCLSMHVSVCMYAHTFTMKVSIDHQECICVLSIQVFPPVLNSFVPQFNCYIELIKFFASRRPECEKWPHAWLSS